MRSFCLLKFIIQFYFIINSLISLLLSLSCFLIYWISVWAIIKWCANLRLFTVRENLDCDKKNLREWKGIFIWSFDVTCFRLKYLENLTITNDKALSYLACLFDKLSETSTRVLRNTVTDLCVLFLRTTCSQKCFSYNGAQLCNAMDTKSKLTKTFEQFQSCLENSRTWRNVFDF